LNRKLLSSIGEFVCDTVIYSLLSLCWHELLHLWVLRMLGGDGYIIQVPYGIPFGLICVMTKLPEHGLLLVYLSGGFGCGLTWLVLAWWSWVDRDWEDYTALLVNAFPQFAYGILETLCGSWMAPSLYVKLGLTVQVAARVLALALTLPKLVKHWATLS